MPPTQPPLEPRADEAHFFSFLQTLIVDGDESTNPSTDSTASAGSNLDMLPVSPHSPPAASHSSQDTAPPAPSARPRRRPTTLPRARRNSAVRALGRRAHAKPVRRCITNETYLRRLYLSTCQVAVLFPGLSQDLLAMIVAGDANRARADTCISRDFELVDAGGTRWRTLCECSVAQGKLHCRLVGGWATFCRAAGVATRDNVVFERCRGRLGEVAVRIEKKG